MTICAYCGFEKCQSDFKWSPHRSCFHVGTDIANATLHCSIFVFLRRPCTPFSQVAHCHLVRNSTEKSARYHQASSLSYVVNLCLNRVIVQGNNELIRQHSVTSDNSKQQPKRKHHRVVLQLGIIQRPPQLRSIETVRLPAESDATCVLRRTDATLIAVRVAHAIAEPTKTLRGTRSG